jgi:hypothetical protein
VFTIKVSVAYAMILRDLADHDLRRLLDAQLAEQIESPQAADMTGHEEVVGAMMALLARDGLTQ